MADSQRLDRVLGHHVYMETWAGQMVRHLSAPANGGFPPAPSHCRHCFYWVSTQQIRSSQRVPVDWAHVFGRQGVLFWGGCLPCQPSMNAIWGIFGASLLHCNASIDIEMLQTVEICHRDHDMNCQIWQCNPHNVLIQYLPLPNWRHGIACP